MCSTLLYKRDVVKLLYWIVFILKKQQMRSKSRHDKVLYVRDILTQLFRNTVQTLSAWI